MVDMGRTARVAWVILALLLLIPVSHAGTTDTRPWLPGLLEKDSITIVVTDSGLGGLSVVADAAEKFRQDPVFKSVELVFVSALFSNEGGYNSLQTRDEKLQVFSNALQSMQDRYDPDIILVACNTLSVLLPDTEFARTSQVPVTGIVEDGVKQIAQQLQGKPGATNILFATRGTVDEGTHKNLLLEMGFEDEQIITQACPQLTLYIEQGYDSMYTEMLIDAYVDEAVSGMGELDGPLSISFNCTHFGYALESWKEAFATRDIEVAAVLNPNTQMVDFLLGEPRFEQSGIKVRVVSMIDIPADRRDSIGRYLQGVSPVTAEALGNFELTTDLFEWRNLVADSKD
jgi:glutamate racemase